ncbi:hypothetical protein ITJ58_18235 [Curtobacterium flaccumfaciens]|uniref:hypothetical protein n=1 Tax=Curtobacterium flaccumfaciens TaxID=2035 RepID=UPI00188A536B|nr:hypothetical protein [Curtobacterium flaccumfaciens]MBF4595704.1 hypothetical protein [Curtobacterium flaccumfaciens]
MALYPAIDIRDVVPVCLFRSLRPARVLTVFSVMSSTSRCSRRSRTARSRRECDAPRAGSTADRLLPVLLTLPVFTVEQQPAALKDVHERSVYRPVQALEERGIVEAVTERVRGRAFAAMEILDEFDYLDARIRERITRLRTA